MSSRAAPSCRRDPDKKPKGGTSIRSIPDTPNGLDRKMVCRKCHLVMRDSESALLEGRFHHHTGLDLKTNKERPHVRACPNVGKTFSSSDLQVEPFLRKGRRRALKRMGVRA